jgi:hypothetical protein
MPGKNQDDLIRQKCGCGSGSGAAGKGPLGTCVCLACGHQVNHEPGVPCREVKCPQCRGTMTRGNG